MNIVKQKMLWQSATVIRTYAARKKELSYIISGSRVTSLVLYFAAPAAKKVKKLGKLGPIMEKKVIPVETDAHKLVNYVCGSNIYKTGEDVKVSLILQLFISWTRP